MFRLGCEGRSARDCAGGWMPLKIVELEYPANGRWFRETPAMRLSFGSMMLASVRERAGLFRGPLFALLMSCCLTGGATDVEGGEQAFGRQCVILLHGLLRSPHSLDKMECVLTDAGFVTVNMGYPSRQKPIEALALQAIPPALDRCQAAGAHTVHFVTHSLGGILVRSFLTERPVSGLGRVVMISPPNRGSEAADMLYQTSFYRWLNGPAGQQLVTGPQGITARLGPVTYPVGVITGNRHAFFDAWLASRIPGEDDGKVAVGRAGVDGMSEFLVLPYSHTFIMNADEVIAETLHFLRHGRFRQRAKSNTTDSGSQGHPP